MITTFTNTFHHWNYYLALEEDLEKISRYIEFNNDNLKTYSIELAHILLSASSEVDVVLKQLCNSIDGSNPKNINQYRTIVKSGAFDLVNERIYINRYGLDYAPWDNWNGELSPNWWTSYNNVKHERNNHFNEANLQNTINAVGALLIATTYLYKLCISKEAQSDIPIKKILNSLPQTNFLKLDAKYYSVILTI